MGDFLRKYAVKKSRKGFFEWKEAAILKFRFVSERKVSGVSGFSLLSLRKVFSVSGFLGKTRLNPFHAFAYIIQSGLFVGFGYIRTAVKERKWLFGLNAFVVSYNMGNKIFGQ